MDAWTDRQIDAMRNGGNKKFLDALRDQHMPAKMIQFDSVPEMNVTNAAAMNKKYGSNVCEIFRKRIAAKLDGKEPPRFRDYVEPGVGDLNGMEALVGESEQDYVTRQAKLRMAAKQRMAAKMGGSGGGGMQGCGSGGYTPGGSNDDWFSSTIGSATAVAGAAVGKLKEIDTSKLKDVAGNATATAGAWWGAADSALAGVVDKAAPEPAG